MGDYWETQLVLEISAFLGRFESFEKLLMKMISLGFKSSIWKKVMIFARLDKIHQKKLKWKPIEI